MVICIVLLESKKYKRRKKSRHSKRDPDVEIIEEKSNAFITINMIMYSNYNED